MHEPMEVRLPPAHALTFDVEDWYQGFIYRNIDGWQGLGSREERNVRRLLELLGTFKTTATFFVLGKFAESQPAVVRMIAEAGHEIASHGYAHVPIPKMEPESFRIDLQKSCDILSGITGHAVAGYRAASWSLVQDRLWALDIMAEIGLTYDSSIFPTSLHAYGMPGAPLFPVKIQLESGKSITEFPAQVLSIGSLKIPAAGGFYLRAFPQVISRRALRQSERKGKSGMVYLHPYDIDADVPRLKVPFVFHVIRYYNLKSTFSRLKSLLEEFRFSSIHHLLDGISISEIKLSSLRGSR